MDINPNVMRNLSYGLYVVSTKDQTNQRFTGCTVNSVMQITTEPLTIALSSNKNNYTNQCIKESGVFAISILSEQSDPSLIGNFGFRSGRDNEKFVGIDVKMAGDLPVLNDCCGYIVCKVVDMLEASTHTIFLGEVVTCDVVGTEKPMTYAYYHAVVKGGAKPKVEKVEEKAAAAQYKCKVCGYIYDGEVPFEELPEDYTCPICGVTKENFEKI